MKPNLLIISLHYYYIFTVVHNLCTNNKLLNINKTKLKTKTKDLTCVYLTKNIFLFKSQALNSSYTIKLYQA